ncbi:hypothetical protein [Undibacterium sp. WLX3042]|uniref:hypothetical protein n=1 Tax=Undibacterium sp. WLX3042 TaxID=3412686 RepID=UPI003C2EFCF8
MNKLIIGSAAIAVAALGFFVVRNMAESKKIESLKQQVTHNLKDPESAKFREVKLNKAKTALCGEVNAKNGFGAYGGYQPFVATDSGAIIMRGDSCNIGSITSQIECMSERNKFLEYAVKNECVKPSDIPSLTKGK